MDVRFGSDADIEMPRRDVLYSPESRHCSARWRCPLSARTRRTALQQNRPTRLPWHQIGLLSSGRTNLTRTTPAMHRRWRGQGRPLASNPFSPNKNACRSKTSLNDAAVGILCSLKINPERCEPRHTGLTKSRIKGRYAEKEPHGGSDGEDHHPHFGLSGDQLLCGSSRTHRDRRYHLAKDLHMKPECLPVKRRTKTAA